MVSGGGSKVRFLPIECLEIPLASKPLPCLTHLLKVASPYCDHSSYDQFSHQLDNSIQFAQFELFVTWPVTIPVPKQRYCNGDHVFHIDRLSLLTKNTNKIKRRHNRIMQPYDQLRLSRDNVSPD